MASPRSIYTIPVFIFYLIHLSEALYEDQIGKFDWKRSFVGKVKYASFQGKRIIAATEENVLASLNINTGKVEWRQVLENPQQHQIQLLHVEKDIVTVIGSHNNWYVRGWDLTTGVLLWEWTLLAERQIRGEWIVKNNHLIHIIPTIGSHIEVNMYYLDTGKINSKNTLRLSTPWVTDASRCAVTQSYFTCVSSEDSTGNIYYVDVLSEEPRTESKSINELIGVGSGSIQVISFKSDKPAILLLRNNIARLIFLENPIKSSTYNLLPNAVGVQNGKEPLIIQLDVNANNPDKILRVILKDLESGNEVSSVDSEYPRGLGAPFILAVQCVSNWCDLLLLSTDNALSLVRTKEGKTVWTREEALSNIVAVDFVELPVSELDASIEKEFKTVSNDVFSMFLHRLSTQAKQFSSLLLDGQLLSQSDLVRDEFGLHKIIVIATSIGKLFGVDTITGSIVWSYRLPNVKSFKNLNSEKMLLYVQRTARYPPLTALCLLIAEDLFTGHGILFQFDPISGFSINDPIKLNSRIKQAMLLPYENSDHVKPILVLTENDEIFVFPRSSKKIVLDNIKSLFFVVVDSNKPYLTGYRLVNKHDGNIKPSVVWELNLGPSKLTALSSRPPLERLHSQGRVLPDRSVYYKYVNPNLVAVATVNDDPIHKHVLNIYLIDGVSGLVLYSTTHKRAKGPIELIHSENWLVYTYFSERFRRTEIAAAELYEGEVQSNSTVFSSYAVNQLPRVLSQSYILPATPQTLTVTLTERGITNKFLLTALSNGGVVEIPWMILQPRLPDITCGPEDGCIPYMPEIMLMPEGYINYNQTLERTKGIQVAPARLESTSHVLVYGLDIFYTRVAPSKTFDVLKEDFDHKLILLVLFGLIAASYITKRLASRKALRQAWK